MKTLWTILGIILLATIALPAFAQDVEADKPALVPPTIEQIAAHKAVVVDIMTQIKDGKLTAEQGAELYLASMVVNNKDLERTAEAKGTLALATCLWFAKRCEEAIPLYKKLGSDCMLYACYKTLRDYENAIKYALAVVDSLPPGSSGRGVYLKKAVALMLAHGEPNVSQIMDYYLQLYVEAISTPEAALELWRDLYTLCRTAKAPDRKKQLDMCNALMRLFPPPPTASESAALVSERWQGFTSVVGRMQEELQKQLLNEPE